MPHSDVHKKKLRTNLAIFGAILAFCALIFAITMVKLNGLSLPG